MASRTRVTGVISQPYPQMRVGEGGDVSPASRWSPRHTSCRKHGPGIGATGWHEGNGGPLPAGRRIDVGILGKSLAAGPRPTRAATADDPADRAPDYPDDHLLHELDVDHPTKSGRREQPALELDGRCFVTTAGSIR